MLYLKILEDETVVTVEAHEDPAFVCRQAKNNIIVRCPEVHAQGIISLDNDTIYQLEGKPSIGADNDYVASEISEMEYDEWIATHPDEDPEDEDPEPGEDPEEEILTRAELTAKVKALEEELAAAKILLGVSDE